MAITCAAFDDVTGWLILAGITTVVRPDDASHTLTVRLLLFAGYLAAMVIVARLGLRWFVRRRGSSFGGWADDLAGVLLVMLLSAVAAEWLGVHALCGAFFAGLMMPREAHVERLFEQR